MNNTAGEPHISSWHRRRNIRVWTCVWNHGKQPPPPPHRRYTNTHCSEACVCIQNAHNVCRKVEWLSTRWTDDIFTCQLDMCARDGVFVCLPLRSRIITESVHGTWRTPWAGTEPKMRYNVIVSEHLCATILRLWVGHWAQLCEWICMCFVAISHSGSNTIRTLYCVCALLAVHIATTFE